MVEECSKPDMDSVVATITSCCRGGMIKEARILCGSMHKRWGLDPSLECYLPILSSLLAQRDAEGASTILEEIEEGGFDVPSNVLDGVLMSCVEARNKEKLSVVKGVASRSGHVFSLACFVSLIEWCDKEGNSDGVMEVAAEADKVRMV